MDLVRKPRRDVQLFQVLFLYIMSSTKSGRIYGYEFAAKLRELSGGDMAASYGVIYPFLRRMEQANIVRSRRDESSGRVYYELTRDGRLAVQRLPQRLKETQEDACEMLLGEMRVYVKLYGQKALNDLLQRLTENSIPAR